MLVISALPNVYLAQVDENFLSGIELQEGVSASTPPAAHEILNALAAKGDISLAARLGTLFAEMYNIRESLQIISEDATVKIQNSLFELSSNHSYKKKSKFSDLDDSRTLEFKLLGELLREAILNTKKISKNDVIDIIHAVLAIRYCDFVLLDSKWADIVEKIRHRSRKKTTNLKLPYVFSRQNNGIESFLHKLENF